MSDDPLARLKEYRDQLKAKHEEKIEKRKNHLDKDANMGQIFQPHSTINQFIKIMDEAIKAVENDSREQDQNSDNR